MRLQAVFFDFDGVIVDSAPVKTTAFATLFHKYGPDVEKKVIDYHLAHQGVSRFEKFRYTYEHILHIPINQDILYELGHEFSKLVLEEVIAAPYLPGVMECLNDLQLLNIPAYIVSGTPDEEIKYIAQVKKIDHYFRCTYGSPPGKTDLLRRIINRNRYNPSCCLFLGDSITDYEASKETAVRFIAIHTTKEDSPFPDNVKTFSFVPSIQNYLNGFH